MSALQAIPVSVSSYFSRFKIGFLLLVLNTLCIIFSLSLLPLFLKEQGYYSLSYNPLVCVIYRFKRYHNSLGRAIFDTPLSDARFSFFRVCRSFIFFIAGINFIFLLRFFHRRQHLYFLDNLELYFFPQF